MPNNIRKLHSTKAGSDKVYQLWIAYQPAEGYYVMYANGRRVSGATSGYKPKNRTPLQTLNGARRYLNELFHKKLDEGYHEYGYHRCSLCSIDATANAPQDPLVMSTFRSGTKRVNGHQANCNAVHHAPGDFYAYTKADGKDMAECTCDKRLTTKALELDLKRRPCKACGKRATLNNKKLCRACRSVKELSICYGCGVVQAVDATQLCKGCKIKLLNNALQVEVEPTLSQPKRGETIKRAERKLELDKDI